MVDWEGDNVPVPVGNIVGVRLGVLVGPVKVGIEVGVLVEDKLGAVGDGERDAEKVVVGVTEGRDGVAVGLGGEGDGVHVVGLWEGEQVKHVPVLDTVDTVSERVLPVIEPEAVQEVGVAVAVAVVVWLRL